MSVIPRRATCSVRSCLPKTRADRIITFATVSWPSISEPADHRPGTRDTELGRFGEPAGIAAGLAAFASDDEAWLTGQHIGASGGYRI